MHKKKAYLMNSGDSSHAASLRQHTRTHQVSPPSVAHGGLSLTHNDKASFSSIGLVNNSYHPNSNHINGLTAQQSQQQLMQAASQIQHERNSSVPAPGASSQSMMSMYHAQQHAIQAAVLHQQAQQQQQAQHAQTQQLMNSIQQQHAQQVLLEYQRQQQQQQQQQMNYQVAAASGQIMPAFSQADALHNKLKARWAANYPELQIPPFWMLMQYNEEKSLYPSEHNQSQGQNDRHDRFHRRQDEEQVVKQRRPEQPSNMPAGLVGGHPMLTQAPDRSHQLVEEHFTMSLTHKLAKDAVGQAAAPGGNNLHHHQHQQHRNSSQAAMKLPSPNPGQVGPHQMNGSVKISQHSPVPRPLPATHSTPPQLANQQQHSRRSSIMQQSSNPPILTPHQKMPPMGSSHPHLAGHHSQLQGPTVYEYTNFASANSNFGAMSASPRQRSRSPTPSASRAPISVASSSGSRSTMPHVESLSAVSNATNNVNVKNLVTNVVNECYRNEQKQSSTTLPPTPSNSTSSPTGSFTSTGTPTPGPAHNVSPTPNHSDHGVKPALQAISPPAKADQQQQQPTPIVSKMGLKKAWLKAYQDGQDDVHEDTKHPHRKRHINQDDKTQSSSGSTVEEHDTSTYIKDMSSLGPVKKRLRKEDVAEMTNKTQSDKDKNSMINYLGSKPINKHPRERFEKSCEVFIQDGSCTEACPKLVKCRECRPLQQKMTKKSGGLLLPSPNGVLHQSFNGTSGGNILCRFLGFRKLRYNKKGLLSVFGFCDTSNADADDIALWLPRWPVLSPTLDASTAKYILSHITDNFIQLAEQEKTFKERADADTKITWKRPVKGVREMCDICDTTLFNMHWSCPKCGYTVCMDCFQYRSARPEKVKISEPKESDKPLTRLKNYSNEHPWQTCTANRQAHDPEKLMLTCIVPGDALWEVSQKLTNLRPSLSLNQSESADNDRPPSLSPYAEAPHSWLTDLRMLRLHDPKHPGNFKLFQDQWRKGLPVLVSGCEREAKSHLWHPRAFSKQFGTVRSNVVNCETNAELPSNPMKFFWEGFESMKKRLKDSATGEPLNLKLKDWPPSDDFQSVLPDRYQDLMEILPLPEYTLRQAKLNLASRLPEFFVRPDLGPKLYNAYGMAKNYRTGTTNLHLDIADAVNVMMYVGIPEDAVEQQKAAVYSAMERSRVCSQTMHFITVEKRLPGALWHIFPAKDSDKIRTFLNNLAVENGKKVDADSDPIHDQQWYLTRELLDRLEKEHGVHAYTIVQFLGDAIFIPAGAPHQVLNLHSCIKVASDFVSPENMHHCIKLTQEFRLLSNTHMNHEDKLQAKNMLLHSVKDCVAVLSTPSDS